MNWYIIKTKPNAHLVAAKNLTRQNFKVFLPMILKTSRRTQKFITQRQPLFPNYLFIGTKSEEISWKSINSTRGVASAVTLDGKYREINSDFMISLQRKCDATGIFQPEEKISLGDLVKVKQGPFTDFLCNVESIKEDQRIWVLIGLLHQKIRTCVSIKDVSKVN